MNSYIPGKGFQDGWNDRRAGVPSKWMGCATTDNPYWSEYKHGYTEADIDILANARRDVREQGSNNPNSKFLAE